MTTPTTPSKLPRMTNPKATESVSESAPLGPDEPETKNPMVKPMPRGGNPYTVRKSKTTTKNRITDIGTFLNIAANYVDILLRNDKTLESEPWYDLWETWIEEGLLEDATLHMISVIVELPPTVKKTNKSVALFILQKIPILERYMMIPSQTRDSDPWLHTTRPIIMRKTAEMQPKENLDDSKSPQISEKSTDKSKISSTETQKLHEDSAVTVLPFSTPLGSPISAPKESANLDNNPFTPLTIADADEVPLEIELETLEEPTTTAAKTKPSGSAGIFDVHQIIDRRIYKQRPQYKIRWSGYTAKDDTWEPVEHLSSAGNQSLIVKFEKDLPELKNILPPKVNEINDVLMEIHDETADLDVALKTYSTEPIVSPTTPTVPDGDNEDKDASESLVQVDDKEKDEFQATVDAASSSSSTNQTIQILAAQEAWNKERINFQSFIAEQHKLIEQKHKDVVRAHAKSISKKIDDTIIRVDKAIHSATVTATSNFMAASNSQQDIINDLSHNTIEKCTELCENLEEKLDKEGDAIINSVVTKMNDAEHDSITKNKADWSTLSNSVKLTLSSLAQANSTAIKNNKILSTKLASSEIQLQTLDETIAVQSATIQNLCINLDRSEARLKLFQDSTSPEFATIVDEHANTLIRAAVNLHVETASTKASNFGGFQTTCNSIEEDASKRLQEIVEENCELMQDKANDLHASITTAVNRASSYKTEQNHAPQNDNPEMPERSTLFPQVDPTSIRPQRNLNENPDVPSSTNHGNMNNPNRYSSNTDQPHQQRQLRDSKYIFNSQTTFVNTNTFYKLRWNNKCSSELDIFTFYKSLQHMASTCGIPMRDLKDIDETHGVCPLTPSNCENYDTIYKLMKGAIYYKINDATLWTGFDQGWNLVKSNLLDCDGFEVMFDILSEVLPKLNKNTPKSHKIKRPTYTECDNDNIYSYVNAYNAFLEFERLENNQRTYTEFEIAVYIADDLERDPHKRFDKGIDHVRLQLKHSPDGIRVPKDILITKIAKTICKYSPEYVVGEYNDSITPVIRALHQKQPYSRNDDRQQKRRPPAKNTTLKCRYCCQLGHDETSENGCMVYAKWTLCHQASVRISAEDTKANTRKYLKSIKRRESDQRTKTKFEKHIRALQDNTNSLDNSTLIHTLQAMQLDTESEQSSSDSESDDSE